MSFALLKGEWTYRIMYFLSFNTLIVILSGSEGFYEILRAKALRMTQRQVIKKTNRQNLCDCHPERSEGSHEILRAKALRMTQRQVIKKTNRQNLCYCHPER
jgi:hypothetical protein